MEDTSYLWRTSVLFVNTENIFLKNLVLREIPSRRHNVSFETSEFRVSETTYSLARCHSHSGAAVSFSM